MGLVYHITTLNEWKQAKLQGFIEAPSLQSEGFIHCSNESQIEGVLSRYFTLATDLVKLTIDTEKLTSPLRLEMSPSINELFPHVYGSISLDSIIAVTVL